MFVLNLLCNSAFEQGHLELWWYRNSFIIINYRLVPEDRGVMTSGGSLEMTKFEK